MYIGHNNFVQWSGILKMYNNNKIHRAEPCETDDDKKKGE